MSERAPVTPERHEHHEHTPTSERHEHKAEKSVEQHNVEKPDVEAIKHTIEAEAISGQELAAKQQEQETPATSQYLVNQELKSIAFNRLLTRTRKHLSAPSRVFSKVVHQPVVDAASQAGEKTFARPSGLLGGSLVALVGSSLLLYLAKHYGFRYNLLVFVGLFAIGYAAGVIIELFGILFRKASH